MSYERSERFRASDSIFYTITRDIDPVSPDTWDSEDVFLASKYRNFSVRESFLSQDPPKEEYWVFPLWVYDHSGIHLSTGGPVCQWDSCNPGYVYVRKDVWQSQKEALKAADGLLEDWNYYLSGDVWGVRVYKDNVCGSCGNNDPEELEACWGISGYSNAEEEAKLICTTYT